VSEIYKHIKDMNRLVPEIKALEMKKEREMVAWINKEMEERDVLGNYCIKIKDGDSAIMYNSPFESGCVNFLLASSHGYFWLPFDTESLNLSANELKQVVDVNTGLEWSRWIQENKQQYELEDPTRSFLELENNLWQAVLSDGKSERIEIIESGKNLYLNPSVKWLGDDGCGGVVEYHHVLEPRQKGPMSVENYLGTVYFSYKAVAREDEKIINMVGQLKKTKRIIMGLF
jgi:hypothetical protein